MKLISFILLAFFLPQQEGVVWQTDMKAATQEAQTAGKQILLSFSGSDWCIPCIRMHKTYFGDSAFQSFAGEKLVLVNADFPRLSKNALTKVQQKMNDALAEKYNPNGIFPYTVLLDTNCKIIHVWAGAPEETPEQFTGEIRQLIHGTK